MNKQNNFSSLGYEEPSRNADVRTVTPGQASGTKRCSRAVLPSAFIIDPLLLFPDTSVITVLGRVEDWTLEWAGRIRCTLCLSIGDLPLVANRDTMPLEIQNGSWVRARLMLRPSSHGSATRLLSVTVVRPEQPVPTSWTPTVACHRNDHMRRLRLLLSQLEPGLQSIFMAVMVNTLVQHGFLFRIAASDHHTYPGGLFDHSIEAAELAYQQEGFSDRERGLAALTCLLFDLGKVFDEQIRADRPRRLSGLEPHANTARCLAGALDSVARFEPELVVSLHRLFATCDWTEWIAAPGVPTTLKQSVHHALQESWQLEKPGKDFSTKKGAKK